MTSSKLFFVSCAGLVAQTVAIDNGLGLKPPMGWRSWNLYGANVDQGLITRIMDGLVEKRHKVDGVPTSLCDLGYCDAGLDDNWQACGQGTQGYQYHLTYDGDYYPVVNTSRFPDFKAMTDHAHKLGLTAGWYHNNCICEETKDTPAPTYEGDVRALFDFGFDAVKLDNCGTQKDLNIWANLLNQSSKPIMIENCHWGETVPNATWCPWNFFRTSGDVRASYGSVIGNLLTTVQWAQKGLSRPGCWAYPDMLQVGVANGVGGKDDPGLTLPETRAHFGSWCIVSSPLTISHDIFNDTIAEQVWPIISNKEAIAVNQAWAGHSGSPFKNSPTKIELEDYNMRRNGELVPHANDVFSWQYFYKPLGEGKTAVLLMNHDSKTQDLVLNFADVPGLGCTSCHVRDVWKHADLGDYKQSVTATVVSHDAAFFVLSKTQGEEVVAMV